RFFARDLPPGVVPPPLPPPLALTPLQCVAQVIQQAVSVLTVPPAPGHCHWVELEVDLPQERGKTRSYEGSLIRGSNGQFRLTASGVPEVGSLAIGSGEHPWMAAAGGKVFVGRLEAREDRSVAAFLRPELLLKVHMVGGAAAALALAPDAFSQYVSVSEREGAGEERILELSLHHKHARGQVALRIQRESLSPLGAEFAVGSVTGTVRVRHWALDTVASPALFEEPRGTSPQEVPQADLLRMFATVLTFAMESVE
ncbi:MAG: hypothetical protein JXR77_04790, partial [Lentisphaeria bacterium]|nr:hypothetical protein [Lentisphaeria bacterium]